MTGPDRPDHKPDPAAPEPKAAAEPPEGQESGAAEPSEETASATTLPPADSEEPEAAPTDSAADPAADPVPVAGAGAAEPQPLPQPAPRRGGFAGLVAGGIVAAAIGFGLARFVVPEGWPTPAAPSAELLAAQDGIAALEARVAGLDATGRIDALTEDLAQAGVERAALADVLSGLEDRIAALEAQPEAGAGADALDALEREIETLRARVEEGADRALIEEIEALTAASQAEREAAEARAAVLQAEAERTARAAVARGALLRAQAAVDSGGALGPALEDLAAAGIDLPASLRDHAGGVPTLAELQDAFPPAARAALAIAAEAEAGDDLTGRVTAFLRAQTGARSLTPRDGDDADAVLSRAEAALRGGDLGRTLEELDALPEAPAAAMTDWRAAAQARVDALSALGDLTATLDGE